MHSYLRRFRGAGKEKDDFISAVNSAASSFGEFAGKGSFVRDPRNPIPAGVALDRRAAPIQPPTHPKTQNEPGPILGGVMYEKLPRRPEISCKVGGDVEDCSTGAAWTCFIFALVLVPVVGALLGYLSLAGIGMRMCL